MAVRSGEYYIEDLSVDFTLLLLNEGGIAQSGAIISVLFVYFGTFTRFNAVRHGASLSFATGCLNNYGFSSLASACVIHQVDH